MKLMANHFSSTPSFAEISLEKKPSTKTKSKVTNKDQADSSSPEKRSEPKLCTTFDDDDLDNNLLRLQ